MKKVFVPFPLEEEFELPKDKAHHLLNVLRHDTNKPIIIGDGDGRMGQYHIDGTGHVKLVQYLEGHQYPNEIVLVQSFLKGEKFELVLQKAVELGVDEVYATKTEFCVATYDAKKLVKKAERWQKIMEEAAQQSNQTQLADLIVDQSFKEIVDRECGRADTAVLLAYENEDGLTIKQVLSKSDKTRFVIFIGPEGGFHPKEVDYVRSQGGQIVTLGEGILRAETASIASLAMAYYALRLT